MFKLFFLCLSFILSIFLSTSAFAQEEDQFIILANPVRISEYNNDPLGSLISQHKELSSRGLPATWLFTYDAINIPGLKNFTDSVDSSYDFGIWMEVTPDLAKESGVIFNKTDSWHRSNSVFLSGYTQEDRLKMIDKVFERFKAQFNYYPASVGAWWIDSYSLDYMSEKYGVYANLGVADQHSTDGYHVWGQYWGAPFYPSKTHTAIPAISLENKLNVVNIQWAPRDPLHGYGKSIASLYSTQDWFVINLLESYFEKLIDLYAKKHQNKFGSIVLGLETDFPPGTYQGIFAKEMELVKNKSNNFQFKVTNMADFSKWYQEKFPNLSPSYLTQSQDLLEKSEKISYWYQTPNLRVGLDYTPSTKELVIKDLRIFQKDFYEPYYRSQNKELDLYINTPFLLDSASNPEDTITLIGKDIKVESTEDGVILKIDNQEAFEFLKKNNLLPKSLLLKGNSWAYPNDYTFLGLTSQAQYFLKGNKIQLLSIVIIISSIFLLTKLLLSDNLKHRSLYFLATLILLSPGLYWYLSNLQTYQVFSDEIVILDRLKSLPNGKVLVVDRDCLQCSWHSPYRPAVFSNLRNYVQHFSGKKIVYSSEFFEGKSRERSREIVKDLGVSYIYTVKYEDYIEKLPFSPGDTNSQLLYENGNAQLWMIK